MSPRGFRDHLRDRSFGPAIFHDEDTGALTATCSRCHFRIFETCTYVNPSRKLSDSDDTPDWCPLRESTLRDVAELVSKAKRGRRLSPTESR